MSSTAHSMEITPELELKYKLPAEAYDRPKATLKRLAGKEAPIHKKTKRRLICDTPDRALARNGLDLIINLKKDTLSMRFKTRATPDDEGIMDRMELKTILQKPKKRGKDIILPAFNALGISDPVGEIIASIPATEVRALGVMDYTSWKAKIQIGEKHQTQVHAKIDYVRILPLFEDAKPLELREIEFDVEDIAARDALIEARNHVLGVFPDMPLISQSKIDYVISEWSDVIEQAGSEKLFHPAMHQFDLG